ncbi:hypothetical protein BJY52DRAFT_1291915, partial [Lactarius psammicola]
MDNQDQSIHLKEIYVHFIGRRPTSDLELVFKDDASVKHKSDKFKKGDLVHWTLDIYVRTHTSATLTIQRARFKISVAEISVEFKPDQFRDDRAVRLEDSNHRVTVNFVCGRSKSLADVTRVLDPQDRNSLESKVNMLDGLEKDPQILETPSTAPPPPSSEKKYGVLYAPVHQLND